MYQVELDLIDNKLNVNVLNSDSVHNEYAFYLYRNNKRVETKWYELDSYCLFDLKNNSGEYYVKVFIRKSQDSDLIIFDSEKVEYTGLPYNLENWDYPIYKVRSSFFLEDNVPDINDGIYQVEYENGIIDLLIKGMASFKKHRGILVCLSGAIGNRENKQAPFFSGLNIAKTLNMPLISVSDPSLSLSHDITLGWYAGNSHHKDLSNNIANILNAITNRLGTKPILFGGSGGGFAVLSIINSMRENAYGLVWNPQTSISKYFKNHVESYIRTAFPNSEIKSDLYSTLDELHIVHDAIKLYACNTDSKAKILYLQNSDDTFHVDRHFQPMIKALDAEKISDYLYYSHVGICFWTKYWGEGHVAPSSQIILEVLSRMINGDSVKEIASNLG